MYRSSSTTRVSDEFFSNSVMSSPNPKPTTTAAAVTDSDHLPIFNPEAEVSKKEKLRFRSAENAIHLIPVMLLLCGIILWFFSNPVDMVNKTDSVVARVKTSMITGDVDIGHGKSSLKSNMKEGDLDSVYQSKDSANHKSTRGRD